MANLLSHVLGSNFLMEYLESNLTTIQLALMAINTATCGLVVSKLQEIKERHREINIKPITKELLSSLKEQIVLVVIGVVLALLIDSRVVETVLYSNYILFALETLIISVFVNSIQVLWDTGKSVFVLIEIMDEVNDEE
ncbi:hypothetical protein SAMN05444372_101145 [Flavobacterium micromati]|uniref:Bacteriophage holin family protein n=1 Tax=Flavobacterium micromati TaxID=229205 RepID=A0A1M5FJ81_9FLAO|nr:hypothetical protein [Flavobacterium micromati]SHF91221.1 hypothetical protein SAMN05444372_101145 [Flavobacterium micromati]